MQPLYGTGGTKGTKGTNMKIYLFDPRFGQYRRHASARAAVAAADAWGGSIVAIVDGWLMTGRDLWNIADSERSS